MAIHSNILAWRIPGTKVGYSPWGGKESDLTEKLTLLLLLLLLLLSRFSHADSVRPQPTRLPCPWDSPGKNTGVGCHSLLQGIFLTQGLNLGLLHCRWTPYHLSHQESPFLLLIKFY